MRKIGSNTPNHVLGYIKKFGICNCTFYIRSGLIQVSKSFEGRVTPVNLRILEKTGYQCPEFFRMVQFCYVYIGSGALLSIMGPINYFDQVVQEILQNSYLKTILKTQKLVILYPLCEIF